VIAGAGTAVRAERIEGQPEEDADLYENLRMNSAAGMAMVA
jgi:hypothetical protein